MKILWLCNIQLPIISKINNENIPTFGGWLFSASEDIINNGDELVFLFPADKIYSGNYGKLTYYSFLEKDCLSRFESIINKEEIDVFHIWGTEFKHTFTMMQVLNKLNLTDKCAVSIQGLVSVCSRHYYACLPDYVIHRHSFRDFIRHDNIYQGMKAFKRRGKFEQSALKMAKNVIGRTDWDYACTKLINKDLNYYFCNETLRESFYNNIWDVNNIERHSLFVSQCGNPIKGFHKVLEAAGQLKKDYPDIRLYTTGTDLLHLTLKQKIKLTYYQKYLIKLIRKYDLKENIFFLGRLQEKEMCERYKKSHIFVSASSIENSPNSVGEAMLLGMPVVSSYVGGVKNLLDDGTEGYLYPFDEPYMLAFYIKKIFEDDNLALKFADNAHRHAMETHNRENNFNRLTDIYNSLSVEREKLC